MPAGDVDDPLDVVVQRSCKGTSVDLDLERTTIQRNAGACEMPSQRQRDPRSRGDVQCEFGEE